VPLSGNKRPRNRSDGPGKVDRRREMSGEERRGEERYEDSYSDDAYCSRPYMGEFECLHMPEPSPTTMAAAVALRGYAEEERRGEERRGRFITSESPRMLLTAAHAIEQSSFLKEAEENERCSPRSSATTQSHDAGSEGEERRGEEQKEGETKAEEEEEAATFVCEEDVLAAAHSLAVWKTLGSENTQVPELEVMSAPLSGAVPATSVLRMTEYCAKPAGMSSRMVPASTWAIPELEPASFGNKTGVKMVPGWGYQPPSMWAYAMPQGEAAPNGSMWIPMIIPHQERQAGAVEA
jgi:hypothetical protein